MPRLFLDCTLTKHNVSDFPDFLAVTHVILCSVEKVLNVAILSHIFDVHLLLILWMGMTSLGVLVIL